MKPNLRLKAAISSSGMLQKQVAQAIGVTELRLSQIVTGRLHPTADTLRRLAQVLDVSASEIDEDDP